MTEERVASILLCIYKILGDSLARWISSGRDNGGGFLFEGAAFIGGRASRGMIMRLCMGCDVTITR